eukprot:18733-Heterococcus_DN1.PRE.1
MEPIACAGVELALNASSVLETAVMHLAMRWWRHEGRHVSSLTPLVASSFSSCSRAAWILVATISSAHSRKGI